MHLLVVLLLLFSSTYAFIPVSKLPPASPKFKMTSQKDVDFPFAGPVGALGVASSLVCGYSLYVLKTTSCGLPPGPFGLEGTVGLA